MGPTRKSTAAVLVAVALAAGTASVAAEDVIGEIVATIDGDPREWRALGPDGSGADYNTALQVFGPMKIVDVMGIAPGRPGLRGSIQLTFTLTAGALETVDQDVIYAPEGMGRMWVSLEGEDLITVEHFERGADGAEVSGRLSGRICLQEGLFAEPDVANCKPIEGRFRSLLPDSDG
ncbi:MAG: hypothetical protein ACXIUV_13405 [Alkalilacustris sp.]